MMIIITIIIIIIWFSRIFADFEAQVSNPRSHFHLCIYYKNKTVIWPVRYTTYSYWSRWRQPTSLKETAWPFVTKALEDHAVHHRRTRWSYPMFSLDRLRGTKHSDGLDNQRPEFEVGSAWTWKVSKGQFLCQRVPAAGDATYPDSFLSSAHSVSNFGGTKARRRVRADAGGSCSSASASSLPLWRCKSDSSSECLWNTVSWSPCTNGLHNEKLENIWFVRLVSVLEQNDGFTEFAAWFVTWWVQCKCDSWRDVVTSVYSMIRDVM